MPSETFDGGRGLDTLRVAEVPDPDTVTVTDLENSRDVPATARGRNVRRDTGYFGRGRNRWQVTYRPKNETEQETSVTPEG